MRGKIQGLPASFFFLGSRRGILTAMFSERQRPFFQSAIMMELPPLPHEDVVAFLAGLFAKEGRRCPKPLCTEISLQVEQHPYYVQRLAREIYDFEKDELSPEDLPRALKQVIDAERYAFEAILAQLTVAQVRVIRTLAGAPTTEMLSGEFIGRCGLPPSSVQFARNRLKKEDLIERTKENGAWRVVDPVFAEWLRGIASR